MYKLTDEELKQEMRLKILKETMEDKKKALRKRVQEFYYDKCLEDPVDILERIPNCDKEQFIEWAGNRNRVGRYKYIMYTINFKPGTEWAKAKKKILKSMKKKWIINALGCIEWRNGNSGMHCHIRCEVKDDKNVYRCKGELYNTFKDCVGNKLHVNVKYSNIEGAYVNYVKGIKKGEKKINNVNDVELRKKYGIPTVFDKEGRGVNLEENMNIEK